MEVILLGTADPNGVPFLGCSCGTCTSGTKRDRFSVLVKVSDTSTIIIDSPPEVRRELLENGVKRLDFILMTHPHYDHIAGFEDLVRQNKLFFSDSEGLVAGEMGKYKKKVFAHSTTIKKIREERFGYLDNLTKYIEIEVNREYRFKEFEFIPVLLDHGVGQEQQWGVPYYHDPCIGYVIKSDGKKIAVCTDTGPDLSKETLDELTDLDLLVLENTFAKKEGEMKDLKHLDLDDVVSLVKKIKPKQAVTTHLNHKQLAAVDFDDYYKKNGCENVTTGYDGQRIVI